MLASDDMYRLLAEIANGIDPDESVLPNTPEVAEAREKLTAEIAQNHKDGYGVEVPHEVADVPDELPYQEP